LEVKIRWSEELLRSCALSLVQQWLHAGGLLRWWGVEKAGLVALVKREEVKGRRRVLGPTGW
jgi:hypothetical protein